jgi:endonuclease/exonuclease/phosphatase family metal-dependent hydrolase
MRRIVAPLVLALALGGCRTAANYPAGGPRYVSPVRAEAAPGGGDTLRVVSFNIQYAKQIDSALVVFATDTALRRPDIVLLQEMDSAGTQRIADALGMGYVYYPASHRYATKRDFGNAILTRWPIVGDAKILLPHKGVFGGSQRIATAATLRIRGTTVRVYSVHLGTMINALPGARRQQLRTVLADADSFPRVIIGGDMNSHGVGKVARERGYAWPTDKGAKTTWLDRWDHVFVKGLAVPATGASGTITNIHHASDHKAVWARVVVPGAGASPGG